MEMNIGMGINCKPRLSPTVYNSLQSFTEFKVAFHHIYIKVWKDPTKTWHEVLYLEMDDFIFALLESWPPEWCTPTSSVVESKKFATQRQKEEAKPWMV